MMCGESRKTVNFGGKLSFILSFIFPERGYHWKEGIGGERRPKDRVTFTLRITVLYFSTPPLMTFATGVCRARNPDTE
jgi:hypothetical protein